MKGKYAFVLSLILFVAITCNLGFGEEALYPNLTLPGPLPFEEEMVEPDSEDIIIDVNPAAVDLLISSLNEKDPAVRSQAAWALGDIGEQKSGDLNRKIVIALDMALKDTNPDVRVTVVSALAKIEGDEAVRGIINSLKDEDVRVRREAARALIRLKAENGVRGLIESLNDHDYLIQKYAILALGAIGREEAIEPLKKLFSSGKSILRPEIISALARIGKKEVIPFIVSALLDSDPPTKGEACLALGHLEAYEEMDSLLASLKNRHFYVRRSAVWSLSKLGTNTDKSIQELISILEDEDASVRLQTCRTLAELKAEPALKPLEKRLADDDKFVRRSAARAIVDIGGSAIEVLMSSLTSENILSQRESAWALGYMAGIGGKVSVPPLLNSLKDKDTILRRNTAWAFGRIKDIYSVDALLEALSDNDTEVRRNSAWALGEVREKNALPGLIEHLSDEARVVRAESARALGKIRDVAALEPLLKTLARVGKEHASIRRESAWALGELKDSKAVPALLRAGTEKTIPTQMGMAFDDSQVRCQAVLALRKIGAIEAVEPLGKCLSNSKETPPLVLRKVLAEVLTAMTGKEYTYQNDHREKTYFIEPIL